MLNSKKVTRIVWFRFVDQLKRKMQIKHIFTIKMTTYEDQSTFPFL